MNTEDADFCLLNMNSKSDSEKNRLQMLVEESDIELTKLLFFGDSSLEEKKIFVNTVTSDCKAKKSGNKTEKTDKTKKTLFNSSKNKLSVENKRKSLKCDRQRIVEIFGMSSDEDYYDFYEK